MIGTGVDGLREDTAASSDSLEIVQIGVVVVSTAISSANQSPADDSSAYGNGEDEKDEIGHGRFTCFL